MKLILISDWLDVLVSWQQLKQIGHSRCSNTLLPEDGAVAEL